MNNQPPKLSQKFLGLLSMYVGGFVLVLSLLTLVVSAFNSSSTIDMAQAQSAPVEPQCQTVSNQPAWNPYPLVLNLPNPDVAPGACKDIPLLSFFPINESANNPREINILQSQNFSIQIYYNNGAIPSGEKIQNPTVKTEVVKASETRYVIKATLSGSNVASVTSAQKGGDLIVNVPAGTKLSIVANSTQHFPDALERQYLSQTTGASRYDDIPDNSQGSIVSNPIYSSFSDVNLGSTAGFNIKSGGLEPGFLGYGYILSQINALVTPQENNLPPVIPGQEITIIRGQEGSFQALNPTDPDNNYPITLDLTKVPGFCTVQGTPNNQGGGQIINCKTGANTPVRTEFPITPTDSKGLVGTPGTFIVNVIDPNLNAVKRCFKKGTQTECKDANLRAGDDITYQITATNSSNVQVQNLRIVDTYDRTKLTSISNISDSGQHASATGTITWNNLGNLSAGASKSVTFDAKLAQSVANGTIIVNTAVVSATGIPPKTVKAEFPVGGDLTASKKCYKKGTQTSCDQAGLKAGDAVTYVINVANTTASTINNVRVVDTYDKARLTQITNIQPTGTHDQAAGRIAWSLGNLAPNATRDLTFDATILSTVKEGDRIINIAVVSADNIPDKTVRVEFPVGSANPVLSTSNKICLKKGTQTSCDRARMKPGEQVVYLINVKNTGQGTAKNVRVIDTYDSQRLQDITGIQPNGTHNSANATITWELGDITPGQTRTVQFQATIRSNVLNGTIIDNVAVIKADNLPDQTVEVDFPVVIAPRITPRSGGLAIFSMIMGIALMAGGYYYYQKLNSQKVSAGFTPSRSQEVSIQPTNSEAKTIKNISKRSGLKTPPKK